MIVTKTKQQKKSELLIINKLTPIIKDGYGDKPIQKELKEVMPLFIDNIYKSLEIKDFITSDLLHSIHFNDRLMDVVDIYDNPTVIAIILKSFSELDTSGKTFFFSQGSSLSVNLDDKQTTIQISTFQFKHVIKGEIEYEMELFCKGISRALQSIIKKHKYIILSNADFQISYDDDLYPTIVLFLNLQFHEKENENLEDIKINMTTSQEYKDLDIPFEKEMWLSTPNSECSPIIDTLDEDCDSEYPPPNEALINAANKYKEATSEYVGEYTFDMPGTKIGSFPLAKKPRIIKRLFAKFFLGMKWQDYNNKIESKYEDR